MKLTLAIGVVGELRRIARLQVRLFLADEAERLVALDLGACQVAGNPVVETHRTAPELRLGFAANQRERR